MNRDFTKVIEHTMKFEGGLSRHASDSASLNACPTPYKGKLGYHTNKGITYGVWKKKHGSQMDSHFFNMSNDEWLQFYMDYYDSVKGGRIKSDSIAFFLTQIAWGSGKKQAGLTVQRALNTLGHNLVVDGVIGNKTITAINSTYERELFDKMITFRVEFFKKISTGKNAVFYKGWLRRLEEFRILFRPEKTLN